MFWEKRLASWISSMRSQPALPLRVQLWNGRHFDLSSRTPEVTIRVPRASALAARPLTRLVISTPSAPTRAEGSFPDGEISAATALATAVAVAAVTAGLLSSA